MDKSQLKEEIRDCIIKNQNAITLLRDGKQILAANKLLGLNQKMQSIYKKIAAQQALDMSSAEYVPVPKVSSVQGQVVKYGSNK